MSTQTYVGEIDRIIGEVNDAIRAGATGEEIPALCDATYISLDGDEDPERVYVKTDKLVSQDLGCWTAVIDIGDMTKLSAKAVAANAAADYAAAMATAP